MVSYQVLEALAAALPVGDFVHRGTHQQYDNLNSSHLSGLESALQPASIFRPQNKEEVATFVKPFNPFIDKDKFAIRGAGCQPDPGCANIQDGVTVDLRLLTGVENRGRFGANWARRALGDRGLSFFSSREGVICDNVLNYEVVLASGDIVHANANENADLWIALRGGGNNLGIVTRFDLRTFPQSQVWGGTVFYFAPTFPSQIEALVTELRRPNATKTTHLMISIGFSAMFGNDPMCLNQPYYLQAVSNPSELDPFTKIQPQLDAMNTMRLQTLSEAANEQAQSAQTQVRLIPIRSKLGLTYTAGLEPIKPVENGLAASDGPLASVLLLSYWKNKRDDKAVLGFMTTTLEKIKQDATSRNQLIPYVYMSYAFGNQDPIGSYCQENKEKLQNASKKYDPEGVFQKGCPRGFKLFH